ncbi:unnamed protein product [Protopolystoma xenopodis]|uniref:Uncharacterized protein n=1 Tax=Protopolystoma xenopodis TaxID=117903 RepID=A0A3S4ZUA3_9PLAT|nr:unnamed protein product [Protopolystoma xenopodis]
MARLTDDADYDSGGTSENVLLNDSFLAYSEHLIPISSLRGITVIGDSNIQEVLFGELAAVEKQLKQGNSYPAMNKDTIVENCAKPDLNLSSPESHEAKYPTYLNVLQCSLSCEGDLVITPQAVTNKCNFGHIARQEVSLDSDDLGSSLKCASLCLVSLACLETSLEELESIPDFSLYNEAAQVKLERFDETKIPEWTDLSSSLQGSAKECSIPENDHGFQSQYFINSTIEQLPTLPTTPYQLVFHAEEFAEDSSEALNGNQALTFKECPEIEYSPGSTQLFARDLNLAIECNKILGPNIDQIDGSAGYIQNESGYLTFRKDLGNELNTMVKNSTAQASRKTSSFIQDDVMIHSILEKENITYIQNDACKASEYSSQNISGYKVKQSKHDFEKPCQNTNTELSSLANPNPNPNINKDVLISGKETSVIISERVSDVASEKEPVLINLNLPSPCSSEQRLIGYLKCVQSTTGLVENLVTTSRQSLFMEHEPSPVNVCSDNEAINEVFDGESTSGDNPTWKKELGASSKIKAISTRSLVMHEREIALTSKSAERRGQDALAQSIEVDGKKLILSTFTNEDPSSSTRSSLSISNRHINKYKISRKNKGGYFYTNKPDLPIPVAMTLPTLPDKAIEKRSVTKNLENNKAWILRKIAVAKKFFT